MLYGVAGGIAAYMFSRRRLQLTASAPDPAAANLDDLLAPDPADPVQSMDALDQLDLDDLDVDALSMAEGTGEFERATVESSEDTSLDALEPSGGDAGNFYGVHTPHPEGRLLPDDDRAMNDGQNWLEALETSAVENGPLPGEALDSIVDDEDIYELPRPSESEDMPVADRGSGGPAGI